MKELGSVTHFRLGTGLAPQLRPPLLVASGDRIRHEFALAHLPDRSSCNHSLGAIATSALLEWLTLNTSSDRLPSVSCLTGRGLRETCAIATARTVNKEQSWSGSASSKMYRSSDWPRTGFTTSLRVSLPDRHQTQTRRPGRDAIRFRSAPHPTDRATYRRSPRR
jgi:hypothetical protein